MSLYGDGPVDVDLYYLRVREAIRQSYPAINRGPPEILLSKPRPPSEYFIIQNPVDTETEQKPNQSLPPSQPRKITGWAWAVLVTGLVMANLLISMDNTIVADIQAPIIAELGEINKFPWISVGFTLGAASANIFWGQLHRYFDKKVLFLVALTIFEVGSAVCGSAKTLDLLIVGRVICGLGGTGVFMGVMNNIAALTTPAERALYVSFPGAAWAIGAIIGPVVGGAISDSPAGWRWCFYLNVVVGGIWLPAYVFILPSIPSKGAGLAMWKRISRLDWLGFALWSGSLSSLVMGISFGGSLYPWQGAVIIALFAASAGLWIIFFLQQRFAILTTKDDRLFPVHLITRDLALLIAQMAFGVACLFLPLYFIPLYFQFVKSDTALMAGVHILPFVLCFIVLLLINGSVMSKAGFYMLWYMMGSALVTVGAGLMHLIGLESPVGMVYGFIIIVGAGAGAFVQASFGVAQAKVAPQNVPIAVAFIGAAQITGVTIWFSVAYSVFLNTATNQIAVLLPGASTSTIQAAIAGVGGSVFDGLDAAAKKQILEAVLTSISYVWIQVTVNGGICFILSLLMKRERLAPKKK